MNLFNNISLTEAISLTKHYPALYGIVIKSLTDTLPALQTDEVLLEIEDCISGVEVESVLKRAYSKALTADLEKKLFDFGYYKMTVALNGVAFTDIRAHGSISNANYVKLSIRTIQDFTLAIITPIAAKITSSVYTPYRRDDIDEIQDKLTNRKLIPAITEIINKSDDVADLVAALCNTFIHEMVHGKQHTYQINRGRNKLMYRSRLSDPKLRQGANDEFKVLSLQHNRTPSTPRSARWYKLYKASPSEIDAFAHNIAGEVIATISHLPSAAFIEQPAKIKKIIESGIVYYTKKHAGKSLSQDDPKEAAVINIYLKKVYQEVSSYIKNTHNIDI